MEMMNRRSVLRIIMPLVSCCAAAVAADVKIIANPSVAASSVSAAELKSIFLLTKGSLADGGRVEPVILKGGATHDVFVKEYLGKTDAALQTFYRSLVFTGKGAMPKAIDSDSDAVAYVAKTKGAVGYVSPAAAVSGVKTLDIK